VHKIKIIGDKSIEKEPLISVVTVVYNGDKHIESTIESIVDQKYTNIEYIIVDGGSTDHTLEILKKYSSSIDFWISEKDNGIYDAMNKGKKLSNGDWLLFLNSGDFFVNQNVLSDFVDFVTNSKGVVDIFFGSTLVLNEIRKPKNQLEINDFILGLPFCHQSVFVSKEVYKAFDFDSSLKIYGDLIFFRRAYLKGFNFECINLPISNFDLEGVSSKFSIIHFFELNKINKNKFLFLFYVKFFIKCFKFIISKVS
jgi:glycosyltransferase involved in cell wall biosynthesis